MLSSTSKYGIRAVIYLALNAGMVKKIGIKQISKDLNIPAPFLGKILQTLARKKVLSSIKGPHGGFSLGRDAKDITLLDIVENIDGVDTFSNCLIGVRSCTKGEKHCPTHHKYGPIRQQLYDLFKNETISQLAEELKDSKGNVIL